MQPRESLISFCIEKFVTVSHEGKKKPRPFNTLVNSQDEGERPKGEVFGKWKVLHLERYLSSNSFST
jgi:hypothetical protein